MQWLQAVGITEAHLVGHSLGGYIATEVAVTFPAAVVPPENDNFASDIEGAIGGPGNDTLGGGPGTDVCLADVGDVRSSCGP